MSGRDEQARSLLTRALHLAARGAADGWRGLPRGGLVRWLVATLAGAAACFGLVHAVTALARRSAENGGLQSWDRRVVEGAAGWPVSFTDAIVLESPANIFILGPVTLLAIWATLRRGLILWAMSFAACYAVARGLIWYGWWHWPRPRPDLIAGGAAALSAHSFPSGHALLVFTTYGLLVALLWSKSRSWLDRLTATLLLLIVAVAVGVARLRLGAHWPSDVIGGAVVGVAWLGCNVLALAASGAYRPSRISR